MTNQLEIRGAIEDGDRSDLGTFWKAADIVPSGATTEQRGRAKMTPQEKAAKTAEAISELIERANMNDPEFAYLAAELDDIRARLEGTNR